jgi:hypothetical protein
MTGSSANAHLQSEEQEIKSGRAELERANRKHLLGAYPEIARKLIKAVGSRIG